MRTTIYILTAAVLLGACQNEPSKINTSYLVAEGETMGTYYRVTYHDSLHRDFSQEIDSLLVAINQEISTYIPTSTISKFNQSESGLDLGLTYKEYAACVSDLGKCAGLPNTHFLHNFLAARVAYARTNGAFDPTIMPLVNYWGFGYTPKKPPTNVDSLMVDSLLNFVGFDKVTLKVEEGPVVVQKSAPGIQLDFGGTGQGYGVDAVAQYLEWKGINNYLVDIGGECRARGLNPQGKHWTIGINTPSAEAKLTEFTRIIRLDNLSVSTSGNYRNFYEVNGQKYSHFINPKTGFPEQSNLLSVSVFGKNCLLPDALATGFMVMGLDKAYLLAKELQDVEALFIYSDGSGNFQVKYTPGVENLLLDMETK